MIINIKTLYGITITLDVNLFDAIKSIKAQIDKKGIPSYKQILFLFGKRLENDNTLEDYCFRKENTIYMVLVRLKCPYTHLESSSLFTYGLVTPLSASS